MYTYCHLFLTQESLTFTLKSPAKSLLHEKPSNVFSIKALEGLDAHSNPLRVQTLQEIPVHDAAAAWFATLGGITVPAMKKPEGAIINHEASVSGDATGMAIRLWFFSSSNTS